MSTLLKVTPSRPPQGLRTPAVLSQSRTSTIALFVFFFGDDDRLRDVGARVNNGRRRPWPPTRLLSIKLKKVLSIMLQLRSRILEHAQVILLYHPLWCPHSDISAKAEHPVQESTDTVPAGDPSTQRHRSEPTPGASSSGTAHPEEAATGAS